MRLGRRAIAATAIFLAMTGLAPCVPGASRPAERARHAMVAGPEPIATEQAVRVLRQGGNAVDAAVTMALVLAVTMPQAGNIGGGGYMLIRGHDGESWVIDYRETAPAAATRDMFLDAKGDVIPQESLSSYKASGVPGTVAGLALALEKHGTISWKRAVEPAIRIAREGFKVNRGLEENFDAHARSLAAWPASRAIFFRNGAPLREGDSLSQTDLARTLETLARQGPHAFYDGPIAEAIAADMRRHGGLITKDDLAGYKAIERQPLVATYRSYEIVTAPPSSAGGASLIEMLNMLEPYDLKALGHNSSAYVHLVSEVMKRAFADRSRWLADPGFVSIPLPALLSREYAATRMRGFDPQHATPTDSAGPGDPLALEKPSTTHFSIIDEAGNVVSNTYTLNERFGNGAVVEGLGFLLNNEMDDFSVKPGEPNLFGLTGSEANAIAPGKRMASSMTPTLVLERVASSPGAAAAPARPMLVLGSPGGSVIVSAVLEVLLDVVDFKMELQAAVDAPRFHHQWRPDRLFLDQDGFPADVIEALRRRGHDVVERAPRAEVQAIFVDRETGWLRGASDARGFGLSSGY